MSGGHKRCGFILEAPHKRAGETCNRAYMAPYEACVNHRPKGPETHTRSDPERSRRANQRRRERLRVAGLPAGWEGL